MKKLLLPFFLLPVFFSAKSQSFIGLNTSNYAGVSGVFFNPAYAADSRYRWSASLLQFDLSIANNTASYKLGDLQNSLDGDELLKNLYNNKHAFAQANVDLLGPSVMFNVSPKTSFAITTRARAMVTLSDVDGHLVEAVKSTDASVGDFELTNNNTSISVNGWAEAGLTWGNVLYDNGKNFLKSGVTVKYLGGISNNTIAAKNVNSSVEYDGNQYVAVNASGGVGIAFAGITLSSLDDFETGDLTKFDGSGIGFDLGLSYEFRPDAAAYTSADSSHDRAENKYKLKFSVALLDAGSIKYNKKPESSGDFLVDFKSNESLNLDVLNTDIENLSTALSANPSFFTPIPSSSAGTYKVSLPTRLRADLDYHIHEGFYVNVATQLSLNKKNEMFKTRYYNNTVLTPRIEGKALGFYLPLQVNDVTGFNAGAAFRLGPLVAGSSNILSALGSSKMVNVYFGLRLAGSMFKK